MTGLYANLAYYHAVRVGSHEGRLGGSAEAVTAAGAHLQDHIKELRLSRRRARRRADVITTALRGRDAGAIVFPVLELDRIRSN